MNKVWLKPLQKTWRYIVKMSWWTMSTEKVKSCNEWCYWWIKLYCFLDSIRVQCHTDHEDHCSLQMNAKREWSGVAKFFAKVTKFAKFAKKLESDKVSEDITVNVLCVCEDLYSDRCQTRILNLSLWYYDAKEKERVRTSKKSNRIESENNVCSSLNK